MARRRARKNNPPAGLVELERAPTKKKKKEYAYDPHLDPQFVWAGKAEHTSFEVDTVSLHIHERISTQAILRAVRREETDDQLNLLAKPELPSSKEVDFYGHDVGWANRMILGDSLIVMNSLLERGREIGKLNVHPRKGAKVIALPVATSARDRDGGTLWAISGGHFENRRSETPGKWASKDGRCRT